MAADPPRTREDRFFAGVCLGCGLAAPEYPMNPYLPMYPSHCRPCILEEERLRQHARQQKQRYVPTFLYGIGLDEHQHNPIEGETSI